MELYCGQKERHVYATPLSSSLGPHGTGQDKKVLFLGLQPVFHTVGQVHRFRSLNQRRKRRTAAPRHRTLITTHQTEQYVPKVATCKGPRTYIYIFIHLFCTNVQTHFHTHIHTYARTEEKHAQKSCLKLCHKFVCVQLPPASIQNARVRDRMYSVSVSCALRMQVPRFQGVLNVLPSFSECV